jgi:hypothetical protein
MLNNLSAMTLQRQRENTDALIDILISDASAKLVIDNVEFLTFLSNKYKLHTDRFILVEKLSEILPFTTGPILFDMSAVIYLITQSNKNVDVLKFLYTQLPATETTRWGSNSDQFIVGIQSHMNWYKSTN